MKFYKVVGALLALPAFAWADESASMQGSRSNVSIGKKETLLTNAVMKSDFDGAQFPSKLIPQVSKDPWAMSGEWQAVVDRSDHQMGTMRMIGVGRFKYMFMKNKTPKWAYTFTKKDLMRPTLIQEGWLPRGNYRKYTWECDCAWHDFKSGDTGDWKTKCCFKDGMTWISKKRADNSLRTWEVRGVFDKDPEGNLKGPVHLFLWVTKTAKEEQVCKRYFVRPYSGKPPLIAGATKTK